MTFPSRSLIYFISIRDWLSSFFHLSLGLTQLQRQINFAVASSKLAYLLILEEKRDGPVISMQLLGQILHKKGLDSDEERTQKKKTLY
jgi:hypothetical protein